MNSFQALGLSADLCKALEQMGITNPTPIQAQAIPFLLGEPRDLVGLAQTGTGKTAGFGLPLLQLIDAKQQRPQGVIIAPTRELCIQISTQIDAFSKYLPKIKTVEVYGGAAIGPQIAKIKKGVQLVVATPGRLMDLMRRKVLDLSSIRMVVLDEADEMLNMGFKQDIDTILESVPNSANTWLFSATMPKEISQLVKKFLPEAQTIKVSTGHEVNTDIAHQVSIMSGREKPEALRRVLDAADEFRGIIFARTKLGAENLADQLKKNGYKVDAIHGDLSQAQRERVMKRFRDSELIALVATDVAARGIDVSDLTHVIHYQLPDDLAFYTHRSGRTGRAGKKGVSWIFITPGEKRKVANIRKELKIDIEEVKIPSGEDVLGLRLQRSIEHLLKAEPIPGVDLFEFEAYRKQLQELSPEQLVDQIVWSELANLGYRSAKSKAPKREKATSKREPASKRETRPVTSESRKSSTNSKVWYLNVGSIDKVSKAEVIDFLIDAGNLKRDDIGWVDMGKKSSLIELSQKNGDSVLKRIDGYEINGRPVRFNLDFQDEQPKKERRTNGGGTKRPGRKPRK